MTRNTAIVAILITLFLTAPAMADKVKPVKKPALTWQSGQRTLINTVLYLTRVGTRFPAYRCGVYVPGVGVCYMKMTKADMPSDLASGSQGAKPEYVSDVAEILEVARRIGKAKVLKPGESLYVQSRFLNKVYLRVLNRDLVSRLSKSKRDDFLALKKMIEEIVTYVDGSREDEKFDVWISPVTEAFSRGKYPVSALREEGMIIPEKAIVIYRKFPGVYRAKGAKGLKEKLYKVYTESGSLKSYYGSYRLSVGAESGVHLFLADYPVKKAAALKLKEFKCLEYSH